MIPNEPAPVSLPQAVHSKPQVSLLITDLDDTIWHWFNVWYAAFAAQLDAIEKITGIPKADLIPHIKKVHERHRTSEYAFLLQELDPLKAHFGSDYSPQKHLDAAIHAYRKARKATFGLYPGVLETLQKARARGTRIVAFTESQRFYSVQRVIRSGLDGIIDVVYAPEESQSLSTEDVANAREYDDEAYELKQTKVVILPHGLRKPDPKVLEDILIDENCPKNRALYVGDTLSKDIAMANEAGVLSAHAKYGESHERAGYALIKSVTHWTEEEVRKQREAPVKAIHKPDFVLQGFSDLLACVEFQRFTHGGTEPQSRSSH